MSSPAKIAANRANALKSTGPRTPEGKSASSRNAVKHGLAAKHLLLSNEDRAEYEEFRAQLINEHQPVGTQELLLVTQIADAYWRLRRARTLETAALEAEIGWHDSATDEFAMLNAWRAISGELDKLRRYVASFERSYYRALAELRKTQSERKKTRPHQASHPPRLSSWPLSIASEPSPVPAAAGSPASILRDVEAVPGIGHPLAQS